jgi:ankyrin repeat protein
MWKLSGRDAAHDSLCEAALRGDLRSLARAIERGTPVDTLDSIGMTPLLNAIRSDHPRAARFLIEHGASVGSTKGGYGTPLMLAAQNGQLEIVRELLARGADPNQTEQFEQCSPLWLAAIGTAETHEQIAKLLIDAGAIVDNEASNCDTALMAAASSGNVGVARVLIKAGADVNHANNIGETPLSVARDERNPAVAWLLTTYGATSTNPARAHGHSHRRVH